MNYFIISGFVLTVNLSLSMPSTLPTSSTSTTTAHYYLKKKLGSPSFGGGGDFNGSLQEGGDGRRKEKKISEDIRTEAKKSSLGISEK